MEPNLACLTGKHIFGLSLPHGANRSLRQEACVHLARTEEGLCLLLRDTTNKAHSRCVLSHVVPPAATSHEPRVPLQLSCGLPPVSSVQLGAVSWPGDLGMTSLQASFLLLCHFSQHLQVSLHGVAVLSARGRPKCRAQLSHSAP